MRHILITAVTLCFMMFSNAFAHDVWMEKRNGDIGILYGHGLKLDPYDPEKIKDAKGFDSKGKAVKVEIVKRKESALISPKGEAATIGMLFDGGYGVKTTEGSKKLTKREAKGNFEIIESTRSYKYSKAMVGPSDVFSKPIGLRLEIVPQKNPFAIKIGETLPIKVLFEGKPLEGAIIKAGCTHERKLKEYPATDKDGIANIVIEKSGNQIIATSYKTPLKDDPDADTLSLSTNIVFEVK